MNFRDDSEPLLHKQAQVRSDLETFDVPWTPEEDEAFAEFLDRPFPLGQPSPRRPALPPPQGRAPRGTT
jgi:hypothetical protein